MNTENEVRDMVSKLVASQLSEHAFLYNRDNLEWFLSYTLSVVLATVEYMGKYISSDNSLDKT